MSEGRSEAVKVTADLLIEMGKLRAYYQNRIVYLEGRIRDLERMLRIERRNGVG